jgi:hypothetical protein
MPSFCDARIFSTKFDRCSDQKRGAADKKKSPQVCKHIPREERVSNGNKIRIEGRKIL